MLKNKSMKYIVLIIVFAIIIGLFIYLKNKHDNKQKLLKKQMLRKRLLQLGLVIGAGGIAITEAQSNKNCPEITNRDNCVSSSFCRWISPRDDSKQYCENENIFRQLTQYGSECKNLDGDECDDTEGCVWSNSDMCVRKYTSFLF